MAVAWKEMIGPEPTFEDFEDFERVVPESRQESRRRPSEGVRQGLGYYTLGGLGPVIFANDG